MTRNSLKSTTAILAAISLLQPVPSLAQANANTADAETHAETVDDEGALAAAVTVAENLVDDAAAQIEAEAGAEAQAEVDAAAADQTEAEAEAAAEAHAEAEAEAEALAAEEAEAEADAAAANQAEEDAAAADAHAEAEAEAEAEALTAEEAEAEADAAAADKAEEDAAAAADARAEAEAEAEALAAEEAEALAAEVDDETPADVTTETITEDTSRSSDEEFDEWNPENQQGTLTQQNAAPQAKSDSGMSDLQKAGLLALGAAVVGGILLNGQRAEANTRDRVIVVDDDNDYRIQKDDDALLRQPGSDVRTQRFSDGSTRTNVMRSDGTEIVTIRDSRGRVLRRVLIEMDGREYVLFDDTQEFAPVVVRDLPEPKVDTYDYQAASDRESLCAALLAADQRDIGRSFSLQQVREIHEVRKLSPEINLQNVTFATASAAIQPSQAEQLRQMGLLMRDSER